MELLISAVYCYRANILNNDASPKHKLAEGTGFQRPQENCLRTQWRCVALAGGVSHSFDVPVCQPVSGDSDFLHGRTWIFQVFCFYFSFYAPNDLEQILIFNGYFKIYFDSPYFRVLPPMRREPRVTSLWLCGHTQWPEGLWSPRSVSFTVKLLKCFFWLRASFPSC